MVGAWGSSCPDPPPPPPLPGKTIRPPTGQGQANLGNAGTAPKTQRGGQPARVGRPGSGSSCIAGQWFSRNSLQFKSAHIRSLNGAAAFVSLTEFSAIFCVISPSSPAE